MTVTVLTTQRNTNVSGYAIELREKIRKIGEKRNRKELIALI